MSINILFMNICFSCKKPGMSRTRKAKILKRINWPLGHPFEELTHGIDVNPRDLPFLTGSQTPATPKQQKTVPNRIFEILARGMPGTLRKVLKMLLGRFPGPFPWLQTSHLIILLFAEMVTAPNGRTGVELRQHRQAGRAQYFCCPGE